MRVFLSILFVLIGVYGATVAVKPHLAVRRSEMNNAVKINIARLKGLAALGLAAFLLWRRLR